MKVQNDLDETRLVMVSPRSVFVDLFHVLNLHILYLYTYIYLFDNMSI